MSRLAKVAAAALVAAVGVFIACGQPQAAIPQLSVASAPRQIDGLGQESTITVEATDEGRNPGSGSVKLSAGAGGFGGSPSTTVTLSNGKATATFGCVTAEDARCAGVVRIDAEWDHNGTRVTSSTTVIVGQAQPEDAGFDGGTGPGPDSGTDGGWQPPDGSVSVGDGGFVLSVSNSRPKIFLDVGDYSVVTATLRTKDGGAIAGESIELSTTLGGLTLGDAGTPAASLTTTTSSAGAATAHFVETGTAGVATITALHPTSGASAQTSVEILRVQQISWVSTKCLGVDCTIMGMKGSGFNEQAQVTFRAIDSGDLPAAGIAVSFDIPNAPTGVSWEKTGVTNTQGMVTINISSGGTIGAFTVKAVVIPGLVEATSPTIGIRGGVPSNWGFSLQCLPVNIAAHVSPTPPAEFPVNCEVKLVDRFNNPVGTGTSVSFKTEAGAIPNAVATKKYDPSGNNTDEGTGKVVFSTIGVYPPRDVPPLAANSGQWPNGRDAEPSVSSGALTLNPRDGLVTVIAYVRGEEHYFDDNQNGIRDANERFIDQGEPFVDENDNGVWDQGEIYIDEAPADGQWNAPNGQWDRDTTIWTETRLLYTARPVGASPHSFITPNPFSTSCSCAADGGTPCTGGVGKGSSVSLSATFGDSWLNRPQSATTRFSIKHTATKGSVGLTNTSIQDGYGFGIERKLVAASTQQECSPGSGACHWKVLFYDWQYASTSGTVTGASPTDTKVCEPDNVTIEADVLQVKTGISSSGAIN